MTSIEQQIDLVIDIKSAMYRAGLTAAGIERSYKLYKGCVYDTIRRPNESGEAAIADALGLEASDLWPERYDTQTCQRLSPQPRANYDRLPSLLQRQKRKLVRT